MRRAAFGVCAVLVVIGVLMLFIVTLWTPAGLGDASRWNACDLAPSAAGRPGGFGTAVALGLLTACLGTGG